jgi:hypothetical protein
MITCRNCRAADSFACSECGASFTPIGDELQSGLREIVKQRDEARALLRRLLGSTNEDRLAEMCYCKWCGASVSNWDTMEVEHHKDCPVPEALAATTP